MLIIAGKSVTMYSQMPELPLSLHLVTTLAAQVPFKVHLLSLACEMKIAHSDVGICWMGSWRWHMTE